jgi:predicted Na+-dependent transporter
VAEPAARRRRVRRFPDITIAGGSALTPTLVLTAAFLGGLLIQPLAIISPNLVAGFLALALLLTEISRSTTDATGLRLRPLILFSALRFVALPPLLFWAARSFIPDLAQGVGLLALVPAGVAAPTLTRTVGGNTSRSSVLLAITTVLFVCWMPVLQRLLGTGPPGSLAAQVAAIALLPLVVAGPVRRALHKSNLSWVVRYASPTALLLVALTIAAVTARSWQLVSTSPYSLAALAGVALLEFVLFYLVAGCYCRVTGETDPASYMIPSGFNNNVLGAVIATIHLSPLTAFFMAASNPVCSLVFLAWSARPRRFERRPRERV